MNFKKKYYTKRLLDYISQEIDQKNYNELIWLGQSPGFPLVYRMLLDKGIRDIRILDNDSKKHGWIVKPEGPGYEAEEIVVEPFRITPEEKNKLFVCVNPYYKEFVRQLAGYGVSEERILNVYSMMVKWMKEEEAALVKDFHQMVGRELQMEQLKILKRFRDFCRENQLTWFLGEGTLLGAVRHKGFIPWDDDIDVFMPYEDYLRLISLFPKGETDELLDWRIDETYPFQFAKIIERNTCQLHPIPFGYYILGCYIDIFPIAGFPEEERAIAEKHRRHKILDSEWIYNMILMDFYITDDCDKPHLLDYKNGNNDLPVDCKNDSDAYWFFNCKKRITDEKYKIPFYESKMVGTMQQIAGNTWAIPRDAFSKTINMQFEDDVFPVPAGYDIFLSARYGDYMTPPPVEKQRVHSYPTYRMR